MFSLTPSNRQWIMVFTPFEVFFFFFLLLCYSQEFLRLKNITELLKENWWSPLWQALAVFSQQLHLTGCQDPHGVMAGEWPPDTHSLTNTFSLPPAPSLLVARGELSLQAPPATHHHLQFPPGKTDLEVLWGDSKWPETFGKSGHLHCSPFPCLQWSVTL